MILIPVECLLQSSDKLGGLSIIKLFSAVFKGAMAVHCTRNIFCQSKSADNLDAQVT